MSTKLDATVLALRSGKPRRQDCLDAADAIESLEKLVGSLAEKIYVPAPALPPLTRARKRVLDAYRDIERRTGWSPTHREVAAEIGLSVSTVFQAVRRLRKDGHLPPGRGFRGTVKP